MAFLYAWAWSLLVVVVLWCLAGALGMFQDPPDPWED